MKNQPETVDAELVEEIGYENIEKFVMFVVELGNVLPDVLSAGNPIARVYAMRALTDEVMALTTISLKTAKKEWENFSQKERKELRDKAAKKFDIENDKIEAVIERGIDLALKWTGLIDETIGYAGEIKVLKQAESAA